MGFELKIEKLKKKRRKKPLPLLQTSTKIVCVWRFTLNTFGIIILYLTTQKGVWIAILNFQHFIFLHFFPFSSFFSPFYYSMNSFSFRLLLLRELLYLSISYNPFHFPSFRKKRNRSAATTPESELDLRVLSESVIVIELGLFLF